MNKKFGLFIFGAALVLGFVGCKEPQLAVDGIDFAYNNYQTIHVTNNSSSALSVEGSAMFANAHSDGGYGLCCDSKKSVLSLEPGKSGTIGFRRTVGLGIPDVSFEATFKYGNKNLTYAGWSEDFKSGGDNTNRSAYGLLWMHPERSTDGSQSIVYKSTLQNQLPSNKKYRLNATVTDTGVNFELVENNAEYDAKKECWHAE